MAVSLILGVLVGALLGLTGAGGGILAVPALVAGMGWTMQQAAPVALIAVAGGAAIGAIDGLRRKLVRYRAAALMAIAGMPATSLGTRAAHALPQRWLMALFTCVMLLVAFRLLRQHGTDAAKDGIMATPALGRINVETGRFHWSWPTAALLAAIGGVTGFLTGLLGVGGGFFVVPMLRRFTNVAMHGIVATSLLVIALVGAAGVASALIHGVVMPIETTLLFASATGGGMLIGRRFAAHLSAVQVQRGFAAVLAIVALGLAVAALVTP